MSTVEKVLIFKLKEESPHIIRLLAVFTDFGYSEFPQAMDPLLRAYDPSLKSPLKKVT
ncbi:hypothetical protein V4P56_03505 [Bartonella sp. B35(2025)]